MLVEIACCDISEQTWTATQLGAAHQFIYFFLNNKYMHKIFSKKMEYLIIHMDFQTPCKNSLADTCRVCVQQVQWKSGICTFIDTLQDFGT